MKKALVSLLFVWGIFAVYGQARVSLSQLNEGGWETYKGQYIILTTEMIVNGTFYDSIVIAPERLYVPEEYAEGIQYGDSTRYRERKHYNDSLRVRVDCRYPYSLNLGATVRNLKALVVGDRHLQTGKQPHFRNYKPSKKVPTFADANLIVCASNVQNYFPHVGGYATRTITKGQHALQCYKVTSALVRLNADIYALCELEQGDAAPMELTAAMNRLAHKEIFAYIHTESQDRDTISVGFIYRTDRVRPVHEVRLAYHNRNDIYAHRFMLQDFEHLSTGEQFIISLNHPRSKHGDPAVANQKRLNNTDSILTAIRTAYQEGYYTDEDILFVGDYNAYRYEQPLQRIVEAGYADMTAVYEQGDYSYSYKGEIGSLDRVYASPSMQAQIIGIQPIHWNTDFHYSAAYKYKYNYKNRNIPKDAPATIRKVISPAAKKQVLFRFSDHDPLLIALRLGK